MSDPYAMDDMRDPDVASALRAEHPATPSDGAREALESAPDREEIARTIWMHLCPGLSASDEDKRNYLECADAILAALRSPVDARTGREQKLTARVADLEFALKPFGDCIFNDNCDITVSTSNLKPADYIIAYTAMRPRAPAVDARTGRAALEEIANLRNGQRSHADIGIVAVDIARAALRPSGGVK